MSSIHPIVNKRSILFALSTMGVLLCLAACCYFVFAFELIEARECATPATSLAIKKGIFGDLPYYMYVYGLFQPLLLSVFPSSVDFVLLHRCFSLMCLLGAALLLFPMMRRLAVLSGEKQPRYLALTLFTIFLCPHLADMPTCLATPSMMGLLLANLVLLLSLYSFRGKPVLLGLLVFAAWGTKPYFVFSGFYVVFAYVFLEPLSKDTVKRIAVFSLTALLLFAASCFLPHTQAMLQHSRAQVGYSPFVRSAFNYVRYCSYILPILFFVPCLLARVGVRRLRARQSLLSVQPRRCLLFALVLSLTFTILLLKIGGHIGMMGFLYQSQLLSTPYCLLFGILWLTYARDVERVVMLLPLLLLLVEGKIAKKLIAVYHNVGVGSAIESIVKADMASGKKIWHSPLSGVYELKQSGFMPDNGQLFYLHTTYSDSSAILKKNKEIATAFTAQFRQQIAEKYWDVVYTDEASFASTLPEVMTLLEQGYCPERVVCAGLPKQGMTVTRWVKK